VDYGIVYANPSAKLMQVLEENMDTIHMYLNCLPDSIFEYNKATIEDIDELVQTRIIVLRAANKLSDDVDMSVVEQESRAYYKRALESGEHIAYLVYDNDVFIGAGGVSFYQVMPTFHNPSGRKAYIMNMYTSPEYRRQGIAVHTLDLLVKDAKKIGVSQIGLEATDMGQPLYEKYGFTKLENEMEI
jgi:ribosomal protein S18 acetylase RimI-like enzyme